MLVRTTAARPAARSVGAAVVGLLVTLATFVVAILAFVVAPLLLLAAALLAYAVLRPRTGRAPGASSGSGLATHGFGAGAS